MMEEKISTVSHIQYRAPSTPIPFSTKKKSEYKGKKEIPYWNEKM